MEAFTTKWFAIYYPVIGFILLGLGIYLIIQSRTLADYLREHSTEDHAPPIMRTFLKYFFLFTLPCLVFSFLPFSWPELLFSIWSLCIIYLAGTQLVHWPQTRRLITDHRHKTSKTIRSVGVIMAAVSLVMFMLCYLVIQRLTLL